MLCNIPFLWFFMLVFYLFIYKLQVAKPDKAKLISRMARMGQSMLPKLAQPDAAETEVRLVFQ